MPCQCVWQGVSIRQALRKTDFSLKGDKRNIIFEVEIAYVKATAWVYNFMKF